MTNVSTCSACGAQIIWLRTPKGKSMPADPGLVPYRENPNGKQFLVDGWGNMIRCDILEKGDLPPASSPPAWPEFHIGLPARTPNSSRGSKPKTAGSSGSRQLERSIMESVLTSIGAKWCEKIFDGSKGKSGPCLGQTARGFCRCQSAAAARDAAAVSHGEQRQACSECAARGRRGLRYQHLRGFRRQEICAGGGLIYGH